MTHFPDELIEAARVSYEHANATWRKNGSTWGPWEKLTEEGKQMVCADFAAGLRAMKTKEWAKRNFAVSNGTHLVAQGFADNFITYLTGDGA